MGLPEDKITITLLSEYSAKDEESRWEANYHNGAEPRGTTRMSSNPSDANASVPNELVEEIEAEERFLRVEENRERMYMAMRERELLEREMFDGEFTARDGRRW
ncbi:hypothetical protein B9479_002236 [Cryptococcus floricola]|uniref:Uncharacterized protein n=1 Tax=Cryptococcus floricola TaxID=2591691 RepID=A0A5D3B0K4_9TREE|nr:hypothetical protein B9479_002236 [Cryptococcus floricola]